MKLSEPDYKTSSGKCGYTAYSRLCSRLSLELPEKRDKQTEDEAKVVRGQY